MNINSLPSLREGVGPLHAEASESKAAWKSFLEYKGGDGIVHSKNPTGELKA
jgi:hypothetical protein